MNRQTQVPEPAIKPKLAFGEVEAAALLGISTRQLQRLRAAGQIKFVPIGVRIVYTGRALRDFLRENERQASVAIVGPKQGDKIEENHGKK